MDIVIAKMQDENILDVANIEEGHFLENIVSRKKQMIAAILDVLESK